MKITRGIVPAPLALYLAGEAGQDSREAVESLLRDDPELARQIEEVALPGMKGIPKAISKEPEMEAYKKANRMMTVRTIALAAIRTGTVMALVLIVPVIYPVVR
jgi:hypothetical protein